MRAEEQVHLIKAPGTHVMCGKRVREVVQASTDRAVTTCARCVDITVFRS